MANSFAANRIVQEAFAAGLAETQGLFSKVCGPAKMIPGAASVSIGASAVGGIGATLSRTATSVSASDMFTFETAFPVVHKVLVSEVKVQTMNSDYALAEAGRQLAQSAVATLDKGFFDSLEGLFALAHPRVGTGAGQVGSGKKYLDTGLKGLQGESGEFTYANLATAALAEAALYTAIKTLMAQKNDRGIPLHLGSTSGFVLVCDPSKADVAHELIRSTLSGADMASNFANGLGIDIVTFPWTTDSDDWFLVSKGHCPVGLAVSLEPTARITTKTNGLFHELVAEVEYTPWQSPYEYGIYGSNVA
jgi:hypothetical protein